MRCASHPGCFITVNALAPAVDTPGADRLRSFLGPDAAPFLDAQLPATIPWGGKLGDPSGDLGPVLEQRGLADPVGISGGDDVLHIGPMTPTIPLRPPGPRLGSLVIEAEHVIGYHAVAWIGRVLIAIKTQPTSQADDGRGHAS
jgi:hypothetical protein